MKQILIPMFVLLSMVSTFSQAEGGGDTVFERMELQKNAAMEAKRKSQEDTSTANTHNKDKEKAQRPEKNHC
nr:co-regulatory protein PtrA N-terminal domain-containing protein [uncultured Pseudomonas sp.]